jgi:hypothetical protein
LAEWRAPGGIVAHFDFEAAIAGKARQAARQAFFHGAAFFTRHRSELNPACPLGETTTAAPLRRRGLVTSAGS